VRASAGGTSALGSTGGALLFGAAGVLVDECCTTFSPLGVELRHILGGPHGASPRPPQPREQQDGGRTQNDHGEEDEEIAGAHDRD
jgi:hypothetical protein